ncbi:MAG: tryptophan synthase subunit alpha [Candidatus Margulisiibacteriota bacterium]
MSRVSEAFNKHKALITYVTAGDPSLVVTEKIIFQLEKAGADIIELGIPFSDPLADGPVIQASHQRAVKKNVALADIFKLVGNVRKKTAIPICFMLSYNLVVRYGEEKFYSDCEKNGVDGVIIPDLNPDEVSAKTSNVDRICLIAPNSSEERIKIATAKASGFIYLISVAGVTGKIKGFAANLSEVIAKIRKYSDLPIAIGFGISNPVQAKEAAGLADGVIVGSAIVDLIAKKKIPSVSKFVSALRKSLNA